MEVGKFKCGDEHKLPAWHSLAPVPRPPGQVGEDPEQDGVVCYVVILGEDLGSHLELLICRSRKQPRFLVFAPNPAAPYYAIYPCSRSFPVKYMSE